jgi:hypothetical protein
VTAVVAQYGSGPTVSSSWGHENGAASLLATVRWRAGEAGEGRERAALGLSVGHCCAREERRENFFSLCRQGRKEEKQEGKWGKGCYRLGKKRERKREKREKGMEREILTLKPVGFSVIEFVRPFARPIYSLF